MPPFKDEHILIIAPGSQTTLAQLGLPESFTPARLRISTRMFPAEKKGDWEPLKVRERRVVRSHLNNVGNGNTDGDVHMGEADGVNGNELDEEETLYEEDPTTDEGAVWPIQNGRVVDWSCFFALLVHVYNTLGPPFHTPILVISQPAWTEHDHEVLTQFFFEKFKTPAFCLMDSALAACYAFATASATVIDVGYGKCDVTAVSDFVINDLGRGAGLIGCGGDAMTQRLHDLLNPKGFTKDMCEQLKKSGICEVLPLGTELPGEEGIEDQIVNPAVLASTGATEAGYPQRGNIAGHTGAPRGPGPDTEVGDEDQDREVKDGEDNEGVLDVASIVVSGKTSEFLARKEKEKLEKAAAKKAAGEAKAASERARLPNAKRLKATLHYTERRPLDELNANGKRVPDGEEQYGAPKRQKTPEMIAPTVDEAGNLPASVRKEERRRNKDAATAFIRKDIEVGIERFQAASGGILDEIVDAIHRAILAVPEYHKRPELWDSLIVLGNGVKVKGFKDALLATLNTRYLISPSNTTMFTSEIPSNFTTPVATGANTPQPQTHPPNSHHGPGVNPLLLAATTASHQQHNLAPPGQSLHQQLQIQQYQNRQSELPEQPKHHQTPTSIKLVKMPEYFPEWKDMGTEEATFLGAQVAAKVVFVLDQGLSKGFMSRTEYNELGPQGIHECCL